MVFQTLSSLAWVAVIVLQAFVHFVIGPRYKAIEIEDNKNSSNNSLTEGGGGEQDTDTNTEIKEKTTSKNAKVKVDSNDVPAAHTSSSSSTRSATDQSSSGFETVEILETATTTSEEAAMSIVDPDERDSVDDGIRQTQQSSSSSCEHGAARIQPPPSLSLSADFDDMSAGEDRDVSVSGNISSDRDNCSGGGSGSGRQQDESYRESARSTPTDYNQNHIDNDNDDCIEDEDDEEWRYQLIKDYYASSTPTNSLNDMLLYQYDAYGSRNVSNSSGSNSYHSSNFEDEDDPALHPVGTINTLSEKLNQQRKLAKLHAGQHQQSNRSRSVGGFDHSSSTISVIASY